MRDNGEEEEEDKSNENHFSLNHAQFIIDFRKQEIVDYVNRRIDSTSAGVIHALLDAEALHGRGHVFDEGAIYDLAVASNRIKVKKYTHIYTIRFHYHTTRI